MSNQRNRFSGASTRRRPFKTLPIVLLALHLCGCGEGSNSTPRAGGETGPLYAVSNTLLSTDAPASYLPVVSSLEAGAPVELDGALEFPGSARAYGLEGAGVVYLTSSEEGTMTEVTFERDGSPSVGRVVSFANLGISGTSGGNVILHLSATKAYFVSQESLEIVVWNPQAMEIVETIPLEIELDATYPDVYFYPRPILVGDRLVLVSNRAGDLSGPGVVVTLVDTLGDRIVETIQEPRCHSLLQSGVDGQGDRYFATSDYAAAEHFLLPDQVPAPCLLRMRKGETSFDPDWSRTLDSDLDTALWTGVTQGGDGRVYVQGTSDATPAAKRATDAYELTIAQPWSWYSLDGGDAAPELANTGLEYPPSFAPIPVDGKAYISVWDDVDTTLVNLSARGGPEPGLVVPGFVYNVVRIR